MTRECSLPRIEKHSTVSMLVLAVLYLYDSECLRVMPLPLAARSVSLCSNCSSPVDCAAVFIRAKVGWYLNQLYQPYRQYRPYHTVRIAARLRLALFFPPGQNPRNLQSQFPLFLFLVLFPSPLSDLDSYMNFLSLQPSQKNQPQPSTCRRSFLRVL